MNHRQFIAFWMILIGTTAFGQNITQKMLIGKWYLIKHTIDTTLILDLENPERTVNYHLSLLGKQKPDITRQDSIDMEASVYRTLSGFENYFIEYKEDNTYINSKIKQDENEASAETEGGTYQFFPVQQKIIQTERDGTRHEAAVSIKNKVLTLMIPVDKKLYRMEFRKK